MLEIDIPDFDKLELRYLVMDYNGTLACDGELVGGVRELLDTLARDLQIHIITADTFGKVVNTFARDPYTVKVLPQEDQALGKLNYIKELNSSECVCLGNGRNDRLMLRESGLGIAVALQEGLSREAILHADIIVQGILAALDLLRNPLRIKATLRS